MEVDERAQIIQRGREAQDLLANETLNACLDDLMGGLFGDFLSTTSEDAPRREKLWAVGQAMKLIKERLQAYADTARLEEVNKKHDEQGNDFNRTA